LSRQPIDGRRAASSAVFFAARKCAIKWGVAKNSQREVLAMAVSTYRLFIDGQTVDTSDHYELRYPFNDELVGIVARPASRRSTRLSPVRRAPLARHAGYLARGGLKF
jgi:hypothetical protein